MTPAPNIQVEYTMATKLSGTVPDIRSRVEAALRQQGFGILIPCNVVLREHEGRTAVEIMHPQSAMSVVENPGIVALAGEARRRLVLVIDALGSSEPVADAETSRPF